MLNLLEKGGAIELSIAPPTASVSQKAGTKETNEDSPNTHTRQPADERPGEGEAGETPGGDLIWRVKLLQLRDDSIVVEQPSAFGSTYRLRPGLELIGAMTIGQNRWMFHTRSVTALDSKPPALALALPERVERCTRRSFYRISTASVRLPRVQCWPLLNPASVGPAEAANWALIRDMLQNGTGPAAGVMNESEPESIMLPEVGPRFGGRVINVSGGGLGVMVDRSEAATATSKVLWWMRVDLRPEILAPVAVTVRLVHQHIDSTQSLYCGLAFEPSQNAENRDLIIELFSRYTEELQRRQLRASVRAG